MTCVKCGHNFCWLCKEEWSKHGSATGGYYVCNKYNAQVAKGEASNEEEKIVSSQKLLQKYTYYYKRFKSSLESINFTKQKLMHIDQDMKDDELVACAFLIDSLHKIIEARHVLQWSYSLAYYLSNGRHKDLFEYQQEMLVGRTEALQDMIENNHTRKLVNEMKDLVINGTSSMNKFRNEMVQLVLKGDLEQNLLSQADEVTAKWGCSVCKAENKLAATHCIECTACRKHGEPDCKAQSCSGGQSRFGFH